MMLTRHLAKPCLLLLTFTLLVATPTVPSPALAQPAIIGNVGVWNSTYSTSNVTITDQSLPPGSTFTVDINVSAVPTFNGYEFALFYDPNIILFVSQQLDSNTVFSSIFLDPSSGTVPGIIRVSAVALGQTYEGDGTIAHFKFNVIKYGASPLVLAAGTSEPSGTAQMAVPTGPTPDWTSLVFAGQAIFVTTSDGYFKDEPVYLRYVDSDGNNRWDPGETVVFDGDANGLFDTGDTVIAGAPPPVRTPLKIDPKITFIDANGNSAWDPGEQVVYDANANVQLDNGDLPLSPLPLKTDPLIKFVDTNGTNAWGVNKPVVYDANNDNKLESNETLISGPRPADGTSLKSDPLIKYDDTDNNNAWNLGEPLVYDLNNNNFYDTGEPVIAPAALRTSSNLGPSTKLSSFPPTPRVGSPVDLDASQSLDPENPLARNSGIAKFSWDFGDGSNAFTDSPTTTHAFGSSVGNFTVRLTVNDTDNGLLGIETLLVTIQRAAIHDLAVLGPPSLNATTVSPGQHVKITVSVSNQGAYDEVYNLTIQYTPPTTIILAQHRIPIPTTSPDNTKTVVAVLDTTNLAIGAYEIDAIAAIPVDNNTSNNIGRAVLTVVEPQNSPFLILVAGAIILAVAIVAVGVILRRRRRKDEA